MKYATKKTVFLIKEIQHMVLVSILDSVKIYRLWPFNYRNMFY